MRAEEALQDELIARKEEREARSREWDDRMREASLGLQEHLRVVMPGYRISEEWRYSTIELHGEPECINVERNRRLPRSEELENFANASVPISIIRYGEGYPQVGAQIDRFHARHPSFQVLPASGRSLSLPSVTELDDFLRRLRFHFDPHLDDMHKARRIHRKNLWMHAITEMIQRMVLLGLGCYALFILVKILFCWISSI